MKKITAILLMSAAALLIGSCSQGEKRISLRFKFEPGMKLQYEQTSKVREKVLEADSIIYEHAEEYKVDIEQEFVKFVDDTAAQVSEHAIWHFMRPSKEDSTKMEPYQTERTTFMTVLPNGKIVEVEFVDLKEQSRIKYIKNYYEQGLPVFPSGEKPVGYNWTQTTKVVLPNESMEASTTFLIKSLVRESGYDCALIEYEGNLVIPVEPAAKDSTMRSGLDKIKSKGHMYFAYKEGLVVLQKETWKVDGDRSRLKDGKMVNFKVDVENEAVYALKKIGISE
ncbi:MAG: hypothetical protein AB1483_07585 [Candidatus Zixiibacteriota bacterium]